MLFDKETEVEFITEFTVELPINKEEEFKTELPRQELKINDYYNYEITQEEINNSIGLYFIIKIDDNNNHAISLLNMNCGDSMKLYLFDDDVLMSGANLNRDYFENRQDRYRSFSVNEKKRKNS